MIQKTEIEQAKATMVKVVRAAIRLKHAIAADEEINERLPEAEKLFDLAVSRGELPDETSVLEQLGAS